MTEIEPLVDRVNAARDAMAAAELAARHKRSEFHAAIGALAHAGLTVRDIGKAVALSHQRVQQILGGLYCSFCELNAYMVSKLVAGGHSQVYICDHCIGRATLAFRGGAAEDGLEMELVIEGLCDFCGR